MFRYFSLFIFLFTVEAGVSFAQKKGIDESIVADTLSAAETAELLNASKNSCFYYYFMADSLSGKGDSINASIYLSKVDPYYFISCGYTPDSMGDFLTERFTLTVTARSAYLRNYSKAYSASKSKAFLDLKRMAYEDQLVRQKQENCKDSLCRAITFLEMDHTDSMRFNYLYQYVVKNGWPSLANGSIYATILAIHDHDHSEEYIPIIKNAVRAGKVDISALQLIMYWNAKKHDYLQFKRLLTRSKYATFDISGILASNELPKSTPEIEQFISQHCPVRLQCIGECHDLHLFRDFLMKLFSIYPVSEVPLSKLYVALASYACGLSSYEKYGLETGMWSIHWEPADHKDLRVLLYVFYDIENYNVIIGKLNKDDKLITHNILFETNHYVIKVRSQEFIWQLSRWLIANSSVNLEIDGHTDSEGDPAANLLLSMKRAEEVKKELILNGIKASRLTTKGFGDTKPLQSNDTPQGKANNRRVEFIKK